MRVRAVPVALAALPVLCALFLVRYARSEDTYVDDGRTYWETHSNGQAVVIVAVALCLAAFATLLPAIFGRTSSWIGGVLAFVSLFVSAFALIAITAN